MFGKKWKYSLLSMICPGLGQVVAKRIWIGLMQFFSFFICSYIAAKEMLRIAIARANLLSEIIDGKEMTPIDTHLSTFYVVVTILCLIIPIWSVVDAAKGKKEELLAMKQQNLESLAMKQQNLEEELQRIKTKIREERYSDK